MRKTYYSRANRIVRSPGVDAAVVRKYDMMKGDQERCPSLHRSSLLFDLRF